MDTYEEAVGVCPECSAPIDAESINEACWLCGDVPA